MQNVVIIYDLDNRKLNNDLRKGLGESTQDGLYLKDYQQRYRVVVVKLTNSQLKKLHKDLQNFRGYLNIWGE